MELRWYYFLSVWAFLLSATYLVHHQNPYPLQLFCLIGLGAISLKEPLLKQLILIGFHLLPFLWLPAIINQQGIFFGLSVLVIWILFMMFFNKNIIELYKEALTKHHSSTYAFLQELLGA
jgi:hypothetical protein